MASDDVRTIPWSDGAAGGEIRLDPDGALDEITGAGPIPVHIEQLHPGVWWMRLGPLVVTFYTRRNTAILANVRDESGGAEFGHFGGKAKPIGPAPGK